MPQDNDTYSNGVHPRRNWSLYAGAVAFVVGILTLAGFAGYTIIHGKHVNEALCKFTDENRTAMRRILLKVEERNLADAQSAEEIKTIIEGTDELLAIVPPVRCKVGGEPVELERGIPRLRE